MWDNHQPGVSTSAEQRLPPGWAKFQHTESRGTGCCCCCCRRICTTLTARQGNAGRAWRCGEIERRKGLQRNDLHHCRILPLISPICQEKLQPAQVISVGAIYMLSANCLKFLQLRNKQLLCRKTWHFKTFKNSDITQEVFKSCHW